MALKNVFAFIKKFFWGSKRYAISQGAKMGDNVRIMRGVSFGSEPYLIELGSNITISNNVELITHDGGTWAFRDMPEYSDVIKYGRIKIGDHTFIGAHSIIMPGVSIGKRCVIGAGSVVTKDIPDGSVACGSPAKVIKTTIEYAEQSKAKTKPYDRGEYLKNKRAFLEKYL